MRSPEARKLLADILALANDAIYEHELYDLAQAIKAYEDYCAEPHYAMSVDIKQSNATVRVERLDTTTKGQHFQLPEVRKSSGYD